MTQKAEALIYSLSEMFSSSTKRYSESLAPLMPKRAPEAATKTKFAMRRVSVFHRAAA